MPSLTSLLARNLPCSRRVAEKLLAEFPARDVPQTPDPKSLPLTLRIQGQEVLLHDEFHLLLNKPIGCITALSDASHETVMRYLENAPLLKELRPVGRLDRETSGLLLFTTSGEWVHRLTHPRSGLLRTYHAALARPYLRPTPDFALRDGTRPRIIQIRDLTPDEIHPSLASPTAAPHHALISIIGGTYHEVRRIFAALESHVLSLCRVGYGSLSLPRELPPGQWLPIDRSILEKDTVRLASRNHGRSDPR